MEAAHAGDGEAAHFVALMTASDLVQTDRWTYALAYLGRASKAGHVLARQTLAFLAGEDMADIAGLSHADLHRLHDRIDLAAWLTTPAMRVLSEAPQICVIENLAPPRLRDWIIRRARPRMQRAKIYDGQGSGASAAERSNSMAGFDFPDRDLAMMVLGENIARITGFALAEMESPIVLHYAVGEEFKPHHDYFDPALPAFADEIRRNGQRPATLLLYLNDGYEGGETDFPKLNFRFRGQPGDALLFWNVTDGVPDPRTLHAGLAPTRGEKWLFSQWLRRRA